MNMSLWKMLATEGIVASCDQNVFAVGLVTHSDLLGLKTQSVAN